MFRRYESEVGLNIHVYAKEAPPPKKKDGREVRLGRAVEWHITDRVNLRKEGGDGLQSIGKRQH